MPKHLIIDTDPGIDDALAFLLALASPEVVIDGITTIHGNASTGQVTKNALSVLELGGGKDIPVYMGCELPLVQPSLLSPETHGDTGLGYANLPPPQIQARPGHASDFIIEHIMSHPGEI